MGPCLLRSYLMRKTSCGLTPILHPVPSPPPPWGFLSLQATSTGQLNTILTLYEISNPPVPNALSGIPDSLLRNVIAVLAKSGRAQLISISDGDGVRLFPRSVK
jgi:hypothetical protein